MRGRKRFFRRIIKETRPDLVYLNTCGQSDFAEWSLDLPVHKVVHFHEIDASVMALNHEWLRKLTTQSDAVIGCSSAVSDFLNRCLSVPTSKLLTVHESIPVAELLAARAHSVAEAKRTLGIPSDALLIGACGAPSFRKGVDLLIEAARTVVDAFPERRIHFAWIGGHDGVHESFYPRCMRDLVDRLNLNERFHWIRDLPKPIHAQCALDIAVVPSREDPFPLAMLEMMLLEKPVVAYSVSGIPEALMDGAGLLIDRISSSNLASGLIDMINRQSSWSQIGRQARERVQSFYDISTNVKTIERLLEDLCSPMAVKEGYMTRFQENSPAMNQR